jgi:uronate dehydrogenase
VFASRNRRPWWDLAGGDALGFDPRDDAERCAAELEGAAAPAPAGGPQGGPHATAQGTLTRLSDRSRV